MSEPVTALTDWLSARPGCAVPVSVSGPACRILRRLLAGESLQAAQRAESKNTRDVSLRILARQVAPGYSTERQAAELLATLRRFRASAACQRIRSGDAPRDDIERLLFEVVDIAPESLRQLRRIIDA